MIKIFSAQTVSATLPGFTAPDGDYWTTMNLYGTLGSGTVAVQTSNDNGTTWNAFVPLTDGATGTALVFSVLGQIRAKFAGQRVRFVYVAGGGSSLSLDASGELLQADIGTTSRP